MGLPPTVEWQEGCVALIDQRKLPLKLKIVKLKTPEEVAKAIRCMMVRGAPAIGVAAAMGLALAANKCRRLRRDAALRRIRKSYELLSSTRPTAVNLFWALDRVMERINSVEGGGEEIAEAAIREANLIAEEDLEVNRRVARIGSALIMDGDTILTHCNAGALATVGYGTALGVVRGAMESGKSVKVIATETRPLLQGSRLTTFELLMDGIPVTLITDNMVGYVMAKDLVDKVIVGADRILASGHVVNKIGTLSIALISHSFGIPFYVAAPTSSFDLKKSLEEIVIEERNGDEIRKIQGKQIAPSDVPVLNPAFDVTPPALISGIITEEGVVGPPYTESIPAMIRGIRGRITS
ncbi:S-methyl-5-thioribose-1-phosphate isomerase [Candidatus Bathyarchaeota archaeon]|nr:S-methyl-5-thioribose-1-phosphate isomerase [Candidatus Bathyarchaeota archaeon]